MIDTLLGLRRPPWHMRGWLLAAVLLALAATVALADDLPDPGLTPGAADPRATAARLCSKSFHTGSVRNVTQSEKRAVYAEYGMSAKRSPCPCEVDHLISLEIGGTNDKKNLWPQSYATRPWNARVKDSLEDRLHALVCRGSIALGDAQKQISTDWIAAYKKYVRPSP